MYALQGVNDWLTSSTSLWWSLKSAHFPACLLQPEGSRLGGKLRCVLGVAVEGLRILESKDVLQVEGGRRIPLGTEDD